MKTYAERPYFALALIIAIAVLPCIASAQGTAFTYQGQLASSGVPAHGSYDVAFTLFGTNVTGAAIAGPVTNAATAVSNGLFTATVDFGPGVFTGSNYWLELAVRTNGGSGFTTLAPRQPITPTPYALFANTANNVSGTISSSQLPAAVVTNGASGVDISGAFSGDGSGLNNVTHSGFAQVYLTGNSVAVASGSAVPLNSSGLMSAGDWGFVPGTSTLTSATAGYYLIQFEGQTTSTDFILGVQVNGADTLGSELTGKAGFSHSFIAHLNAGDVVQFVNLGPTAMTLQSPSGLSTSLIFSATIVRLN